MRVLLDTNLFLDVIEERKEFFDHSSMVVLLATEYEGFISATSITDIYYIEHKRNHNKEKTKKIMEKLLRVFDILDIIAEDCRNALRNGMKDYEDAIMVESARRNNIDCIVTRNAKDFKDAGITVYTPVEFLRLTREKHAK